MDILDLLLDKGADVNAKDNWAYTLLYYAIWGDDKDAKDAVELLINKGANVNVKANDGYTPLNYAIWKDNKDLVELLINKGADVNAEDDEGYTPFYWAAMQEDSKELVELLTAKGATPVSTIHMAVATGKLAKVESFIKEGIDINTKDKKGWTPLHWSANTGHMNTAELLVVKGADINAKSNDGVTPLHLAVLRNHRDVTELLLDKGADINANVYRGQTPLHWAAYMGYQDIVELLIAHNANVNAEDYVGGTPLDRAKKNGQQEVVELLQKHGAEEGKSLQEGEVIIEVLRLFVEYADGKYPASLKKMTVAKALEPALEKKFPPGSPEPSKELLHRIMRVDLVGLMYTTLEKGGKDPAYYGDKVSAESPDAVLFRWKIDDDIYRVVFGDLRTEDVSAEKLAELEAF